VAIFGRKTARQRLRRATRESLSIPAFSSPADCTPWVIGGLWPAELSTVTAETAPLADYLKVDLERIANSANEELRTIRRAGMADSARQAAEAQVIKRARAFAVRRVESTVRHLRKLAQELPAEYRLRDDAEDLAKTQHLTTATTAPTAAKPACTSSEPTPEKTDESRREARVVDQDNAAGEPIESVDQTLSEPEAVESSAVVPTYPSDLNVTEALQEKSTARHAEAPVGRVAADELSTGRQAAPVADETKADVPLAGPPEPSVDEGPTRIPTAGHPEPPVDEPATEELPAARQAEPRVDEAVTTRHAEAAVEPESDRAAVEPESDRERLQRLLEFVARKEPGVRWAVGDREDGTTVLVTDVAHGWIPPGIALPAGVQLLEPGRRTANAATLLGPTTQSATYAPGDALGRAPDSDVTESSLQPRELAAVDDLGWLLSEATHWRDGLPRIVHTLAKAGAAGTGVVEVEIDALRVHLEIVRYQLLAQYPDVDAALLLNCLLLAATEGIATGDRVSANYHFAWFQTLSAPPANKWTTNP